MSYWESMSMHLGRTQREAAENDLTDTPPEEPCRCIAAGRGGVHYPSDHTRVIPPAEAGCAYYPSCSRKCDPTCVIPPEAGKP